MTPTEPTQPHPRGIRKAPTGIAGFDEITGSGLPRGRTSLVIGAAGTGKTVFALQTLVNGIRHHDEPGIFVAFEEPSAQIVQNATFGWGLTDIPPDRLFFMDARLSPDTVRAGAFDLAGMLAALERKADQMGARRIAFDSLDVLLRLIEDPARQRQEVYRLHDWLSTSDLTGVITARLGAHEIGLPLVHSFLPYIADCVVDLSQRVEDRVALRALRVLKYRGSDFRENEVPLLIGPSGIQVARVGAPLYDHQIVEDRISTGVDELDAMLEGGYYRGTSTVITGASGTAKTTLAGAFAEEACQRGDRTLYICFDEAGDEIVRNLRSVGIDLARHRESGRLRMIGARAESRSADAHLLTIRGAIDEHRPACLVIDPLSAITKAGGAVPALSVARRLIHQTKREGVTLLCTSLLPERDPDTVGTPLGISTLADTWIHLSYHAQHGERNRAISIVKSRGTDHSNQVRELVLSSDGISLLDVYTAGGEVLMGTLRWEREREEASERARVRAEIEKRRQALKVAEAEAVARQRALEGEIQARRAELAALEQEQARQESAWQQRRNGIQRRRRADEDRSREAQEQMEKTSREGAERGS
jgi:circadian clock protein KaiC